MKTIVVFVLASILPVATSILFATEISNITTSPTFPAALNFGNYVSFDFDYSVDSDAYIWGRPMFNGVLRSDYAAHPSPLYPGGTSGTDTGYFTILPTGQHVALVDEIRFQVWNSSQTTLLLEHFEPVEYAFLLLGDMNNDGAVDGLDVAPFVDAVITGGAPVFPEPSAFLLTTIAVLGLLGWRRTGR